MNASDLWADYRARCTLPTQTDAEIATQQVAYNFGIADACDAISRGYSPEEVSYGAHDLIVDGMNAFRRAADQPADEIEPGPI